MKIAVSSQGKSLDSEVDPRFGRAAFFLIVEPDTLDFEAVDNSAGLNALRGAGIQAAKTVVDKGARVVLTGKCGPKAFSVLEAAGVEVNLNVAGTVRDAVQRYTEGGYKAAGGSNVAPHW